jgi:sugar lactone lactonase YvrE
LGEREDEMAEPAVDCVLEVQPTVGECPVWCGRTETLYWADIYGGRLNRFDPATGANRIWQFAEPIGSFALGEDGAVLAALKSGLYRYELESEMLTLLASPERDLAQNRMNDGRCDPAGRFWVGTMQDPPDPARPAGTLYRLGPGGACTAMASGFVVSNGLAFSPDGRTMYHSDSHPSVRTVWAWDFDSAEGRISNRRVLIDTHGMPGRPDGGCCDAEGCYWMTGNDGWEILRVTPAGKIDRRIRLPIAKPSMVAFGGRDLDVIYITSIRPEGDLSDQPKAGGLFAVRPGGVTGIREPRFRFRA